MFKIESDYITVDRVFFSEDEALEYAIEKMELYVRDWIEEFVDIEIAGIADDSEASIEAVREGEIEYDDIADEISHYVKEVVNERFEFKQRIQQLKQKIAELELKSDNQEAQS